MINIKHKKDLITLDFKINQIRYLKAFENHGEIKFLDFGRSDMEAYEYLFKEDLKVFFKSLREAGK